VPITGAASSINLLSSSASVSGLFGIALAVGLKVGEPTPIPHFDLDAGSALSRESSVEFGVHRDADAFHQRSSGRVVQAGRLVGCQAHAAVDQRGRHHVSQAETCLVGRGRPCIAGDVQRRLVGGDVHAFDVAARIPCRCCSSSAPSIAAKVCPQPM
jgi:hypothetical protein